MKIQYYIIVKRILHTPFFLWFTQILTPYRYFSARFIHFWLAAWVIPPHQKTAVSLLLFWQGFPNHSRLSSADYCVMWQRESNQRYAV